MTVGKGRRSKGLSIRETALNRHFDSLDNHQISIIFPYEQPTWVIPRLHQISLLLTDLESNTKLNASLTNEASTIDMNGNFADIP